MNDYKLNIKKYSLILIGNFKTIVLLYAVDSSDTKTCFLVNLGLQEPELFLGPCQTSMTQLFYKNS